jgi:hypothetical protein
MSAAIMEAQLLRLIASDTDLATRHCLAERGAGGGVTLSSRAGRIGTWRWTGTRFEFIREGEQAPVVTLQTSAEALIYTKAQLIRR